MTKEEAIYLSCKRKLESGFTINHIIPMLIKFSNDSNIEGVRAVTRLLNEYGISCSYDIPNRGVSSPQPKASD